MFLRDISRGAREFLAAFVFRFLLVARVRRRFFSVERNKLPGIVMMRGGEISYDIGNSVSRLQCLKAPANEETLLRKHC